MNAEDKFAFQSLLTDAMAFYRQDVSRFALGVWWEACKTFDLAQVSKAITAHAMDAERGQFPPKPADIVRQLQGTHTDKALMAWGKAFDAMQKVGAYQSVVFDDAAIHATVSDMGGWQKLCRSEVDDLPFVQKRFCDTYKAYISRGKFDYPGRLIGEHESTNAVAGMKVAPPLLIGNPAVAGVVLLEGCVGSKTQITAVGDHDFPRLMQLGNAA